MPKQTHVLTIQTILNKNLSAYGYHKVKSKFNHRTKIVIHIKMDNRYFDVYTTSRIIIDRLNNINKFPFETIFVSKRGKITNQLYYTFL